ncbi:MAG: 50S ribosomal protein L30 [Acidimicrobiia bacterium]
MATVRVTLTRSTIGTKPKQRGTLRALGLRTINQTVEHTDGPALRGMIDKVSHLVNVEDGTSEDATS